MKTHALLLTFALAAGVQGAAAQAPPTVTTPPPPTAIAEADNCAPNAKSVLPRLNSEPGTTTGRAAEPLGDKLARSDGVLCPPPGVDPEIHAPTPPNAGNTPVIPPPGSPGGNPDIRPK